MNIYFLTGATGAVGSAIVPLLLADPETKLKLLLRADSDAALEQRVEELMHFCGLNDCPSKQARLKAFRGDAALPNFSLNDSHYASLVDECTHVIHCAGTVRMNLSIEEARRSAVGSAEETINLTRRIAAGGRLRKAEYVSTVGIAGKRPGELPEKWMDEPRSFHNTYEQAKAEAEEIVRAAVVNEGLPVTVHRPSMVVGDSQAGRIIHFQIFYFICEILSGRKTRGIYPDFGEVRLDVIPVDLVAEAIVASSLDPDTAGRIFHLCSGPDLAPRLEDLKAHVRAAFKGHGLEIPHDIRLPSKWFGALGRLAARLAPVSQRNALATLPMYLDYLADRQGFDNGAYTSWLAGRGASLPRPEDYLQTIISYYLNNRYPPAGGA